MNHSIIEHAPAKLNLALHVTGRRSDGYHLLDTFVVFTLAGDTVCVRAAEQDGFHIQGRFSSCLEDETDNLVLRARDLVRTCAARPIPPVDIRLNKNLPIASGIGGGSSDAAATIRALIRHWGQIRTKDVARAAITLGADVPMCIAAQSLIARGIGEEIEPVHDTPRLWMVLANPGIAVSTPAIFRALASRENPPLASLPKRPDFERFVAWLRTCRNDLEATACALAPPVLDTLAALRFHGAALARMSGSGASCFGLFPTEQQAQCAARAIATDMPSWYVEATCMIENLVPDVAT